MKSLCCLQEKQLAPYIIGQVLFHFLMKHSGEYNNNKSGKLSNHRIIIKLKFIELQILPYGFCIFYKLFLFLFIDIKVCGLMFCISLTSINNEKGLNSTSEGTELYNLFYFFYVVNQL